MIARLRHAEPPRALDVAVQRSRRTLLGADGVRSRVRSQLFGAEEVRLTGFSAYRGLVPIDLVPREAMEPPCQVWMAKRLTLNRYPVSGGRLPNFVAFATRSGWEEEGWSIPASKAEILQDFGDWHPHVTRVIEVVPEANLFKLALCARSALMRWVHGRVALLGDARGLSRSATARRDRPIA